MCKMTMCIACFVSCLALSAPVHADPIYVDADATGANDGMSWTDAYTSLSNALSNAATGAEVWAAEGTCGPITTVEFNGVKVYGGFQGNETSASQSNPDRYITIISGGGTDRAMVSTDDSSSTIIRGFHIINGVNPAYKPGAGALLTNSSLTFVQCVFRDNAFTYLGGAVANMGNGSPRFVNCKFFHNRGTTGTFGIDGLAGAAVYSPEGSPTFVNCIFYENTAMEAAAIASVSGVVTLINCTFANNKATYGNAGALYDYSGKAVVKNCIFWNNNSVKYDSDEIFNRYNRTSVTYSDVKGGWPGTGNISSDPKFVNAGAENYKIGGDSMSPSPCKDSGSDALVPADFGALDWDENATEQTPVDLTAEVNRFSAKGVDMGAYEWTPSQQ